MNIDDLKKDWQNAEDNEVNIPTSLLKLKTANVPKDKIYRRLKRELMVQFIAFALIGLWPILFHFKQPYFTAFYVFFVAALILSAFYMRRFRLFTQRIGQNTLSSKDHLYELYYDVRLVMEVYKSWTYICLPFGIIFGFLHHAARGRDIATTLTSHQSFVVVISLCLVLPLTEMYINVIFEKYAKQIRKLLDELSEA